MKDVRYYIIYKYFLAQIKFGNFKYGDELPPIRLVDKFYDSSMPTVRNAYLLLQEEGDISMSPGKMTTVTCRISEEECNKYIKDYYSIRQEGIRSLDESAFYVLVPLLQEGSRCLDERQMDHIQEAIVKMGDINFYSSFIVGQEIMLALNNQLALNLYHEIVAYYQFPHTLNKREALPALSEHCRQLSSQIVEACMKRDRDEIYRLFRQIQEAMGEIIDTLVWNDQDTSGLDQVAFEWGIYRERPQFCYSLAANLITDIMMEHKYKKGEYLPHYVAMSKLYSVSHSTVRRTVKLLGELGVIETHHGIGTMVTLAPILYTSVDQRGLKHVIDFFLEAMQIIQLAYNDAGKHFFKIAEEQQQDCIRYMRVQQANESTFGSFLVCMEYLLCGNKNTSMAEIGAKLYEGIILGFPLLESAFKVEDRSYIHTCSEKLINSIEKGKINSFYRLLREYMQIAIDTVKAVSEPTPY